VEDALTDTLGVTLMLGVDDTLGVTLMLGVDDMVPLLVGVMDTEGEGVSLVVLLLLIVTDALAVRLTLNVGEDVTEGCGVVVVDDVAVNETLGVIEGVGEGEGDCDGKTVTNCRPMVGGDTNDRVKSGRHA
jgi:hypothetical protein